MKYKLLSCNKEYSQRLNEELKKKFKNTFKFPNNDIDKITLLLRKSVYPYEYIDDWKKFNEAALLKKENFYSNLIMEVITEVDYKHGKRICEDFEIKNWGEYHDLYLRSDVLLLAGAFQHFRKMCLKIHELDPTKFLSAP